MTENESKVLAALVERYDSYAYYLPFAALSEDTGLDRKQVRRACRALTRKGWATFSSGLWNDEGRPAGSGYAATDTGVALVASRERKKEMANLEVNRRRT